MCANGIRASFVADHILALLTRLQLIYYLDTEFTATGAPLLIDH